jgi:hypothetical protein
LRPRRRFLDEFRHADQLGPVRRRHIVVDGNERAVGPTNAALGQAQPIKGLRRRDFVDQMAIHVDQGRLAVVVDQVIIPDFLKQGARFGGRCHEKRTAGDTAGRSPVLRRRPWRYREGLEGRHGREQRECAANKLRHGYGWFGSKL